MHQIQQTIFKPPTGNCLAACVASIFERPLWAVPNFVACQGEETAWCYRLQQFAHNEGWRLFQSVYPSTESWSLDLDEDAIAIATIDSPRGDWRHCVVANPATGRVLWDPHPEGDSNRLLSHKEMKNWFFFVRVMNYVS